MALGLNSGRRRPRLPTATKLARQGLRAGSTVELGTPQPSAVGQAHSDGDRAREAGNRFPMPISNLRRR